MEVDGKEFFERASRMMAHKRSKDMFLSLAAQEKRHIDVLSHQLELLDQGLAEEEGNCIRQVVHVVYCNLPVKVCVNVY